jgi:hypothetical protein
VKGTTLRKRILPSRTFDEAILLIEAYRHFRATLPAWRAIAAARQSLPY